MMMPAEIAVAIFFWELARILLETLVGGTLKGVLTRMLLIIFCCRRKKERKEVAMFVAPSFSKSRNSRIRLYKDCVVFQ